MSKKQAVMRILVYQQKKKLGIERNEYKLFRKNN